MKRHFPIIWARIESLYKYGVFGVYLISFKINNNRQMNFF